MTLEAMSLLTMVLAKTESVLLARNLNNYRARLISIKNFLCNKKRRGLKYHQPVSYSKKQVVIKISASGVLLVLILDSSSLDQINGLNIKAELSKPEVPHVIDTIPFP